MTRELAGAPGRAGPAAPIARPGPSCAPTPGPSPMPAVSALSAQPVPAPSVPKRRRAARILLAASPPLAIAGVGAWRWWTQPPVAETDNACLQMDKVAVAVAAEVGGRLTEVAVRKGDPVRTGDLLFRIDAEPRRLMVA